MNYPQNNENRPDLDPSEVDSTPVDPGATQKVELSKSPDTNQPVKNGLAEETQATPVSPPQSQPASLDNTQPVLLDAEPPAGVEDTLPPVDSQPPANEWKTSLPNSSEPETFPPDMPPPEPPAFPVPDSPRRLSTRWIILLGLLFLVAIAALSAFSGYGTAIQARQSLESTQSAISAQEQFELGVQDIEAGRYDLARQRFEYVIQLSPGYPGVTEKLAQVLTELSITATPTLKPTPTLTPTPDMRGVEEIFVQAQQDLSNQEWTAAIDSLLALRKADPNYQMVWIDDMLYVSYRNRGVDKILKLGDLEGGIYDLTQSARIGPLDAEAKGYQTWARLYITGASFWELDWGQAVYYFAQVAPALPNLRDGSGWTATERYRLALIGYGGFLADNKDWCSAQQQYELALQLGSDAEVEETLQFVRNKCSGDSDDESSPQPSETLPTEALPTEVLPTQETLPTATEIPPTTEPPTATSEPPRATEPPPAEEATPTPG